MKFRFPVIIIDEDFRSENISGSGIRDLAEAISKEGMEVVGLTSYGDLTSFAQQASRASCFIVSIDDEEFDFNDENDVNIALTAVRNFLIEVRKRNRDIPV
ncbi:Orn/Lys/Arg decarboxylase N-terminal domain-containing protein, partial [Oceanospirillum sp. HFRX-1_2]